MKGKLNGLSLFSGYGGIDLALGEHVRPIMYCEIEKYPQGILLSKMDEGSLPFAPIWNDVTTLDGTKFRGMVDIIYGGFPCQDLSVAGKGKGLDGERSGLFREIVRIAKEASPTFIFLENVPAIRTRGCVQVQEALSEIGYDTRWTTLSASEVGANHKRERWFCLAKKRDVSDTRSERFETRECGNMEKETREKASRRYQSSYATQCGGTDVAHAMCEGLEGFDVTREGSGAIPQEAVTISGTNGCIQRNIPNTHSEGHGRETTTATKEDNEGKWQEDGWTMPSPFERDWWVAQPPICRVVNGPSIRPHQASFVGDEVVHRETKERISEEETDKWFRAERIKALGNGVVPLQVREAFKYLLNGEYK